MQCRELLHKWAWYFHEPKVHAITPVQYRVILHSTGIGKYCCRKIISICILHLLLPCEVGGVSCTRKMVPVGEGMAKVVTPLTDIQLLHPVTATMLGKGTGG